MSGHTKFPICEPQIFDECMFEWAEELRIPLESVVEIVAAPCIQKCKPACVESKISHKISMSRIPAVAKIPALQR